MSKYTNHRCVNSRYTFEKRLGSGGYGAVYEGLDNKTFQKVAIKMPRPPLSLDVPASSVKRTAQTEITLLRTLRHSNVVHLIHSFDAIVCGNAIPCAVLELCKTSLSSMIAKRRKRLTDGQVKRTFLDVLKGVDYLHKKRIVHFDLKPENILQTFSGVLKVADFGMAEYCSDQKQHEYNKGTLGYAPPEILVKYGYFAFPVDVWSLGCILGDLLLPNRVFRGADVTNQLVQITKLCGSIHLQWPEVKGHVTQFYSSLPKKHQRWVLESFRKITLDPLILGLLDKMLEVNPSRRCKVSAALEFTRKHYLYKSTEMELANDSWSLTTK